MIGFLKRLSRPSLRKQMESLRLRDEYKEKYDIEIGLYSYGCFDLSRIPRGTTIGRFCSFASSAVIFNGNHGLSFLSLHPYFYNPALGFVEKETISRHRCVIEDDVWLGHGSIILPSVRHIGRGAVIGAGAVVTKDVPPYSVVAGNPAKIVKMRFDPQIVTQIEASRWWEWDAERLRKELYITPEKIYSPVDFFSGK